MQNKYEQNKYEHIFNEAPICIWEEDWSQIQQALDDLRPSVPSVDLMDYVGSHPELIPSLASSLKIIRTNPETLKVFEAQTEQELINYPYSKLLSKNNYLIFKQQILAIYRGETSFKYEGELDTIKGNRREVRFEIKFPDDDVQYQNVIIVMMDLTITKNYHKKYLEAEGKFKTSFYEGVAGMANTDMEGNIHEVNDAFCVFTQYSKKELCSMSIEDIEIVNGQDERLFVALEKYGKIKEERILRKKDGKQAWALVGMSILKDEHNVPQSVVGQIIDIEKSKAAADILQHNILKYQQLLDATDACYVILDDNDNIEDYSKGFENVLGGPDAKNCLLGRPLRAMISAETMPSYDRAWRQINKGETVKGVEIALSTDKVFKWMCLNASALQAESRRTFILLNDITERKRHELETSIKNEKNKDRLKHNIKEIRKSIKAIGNR